MLQTIQSYSTTSGLSILDYRCSVPKGGYMHQEFIESYEFGFVRRGAYRMRVRGREFVATQNEVFCLRPGDVYQVAHPIDCGDESTILGFPEELIGTLLDAQGCALHGRGDPFGQVHRLIDADTFLLQRTFLKVAADESVETELDELLEHLVHRLVSRPSWRRSSDLEIARRTQEYLAANYTARATLAQIGAAVGTSPFHLSRLFRTVTGTSIHRYLTNLRLREAVDRLQQGAADLTDLALDLGFSSHAHFTYAFRMEFGMTPSAYRASH